MQNNQEMIREAMRLANSPAGKQLLDLLQKQSPDQLQQAVNQAAAGDYEQAKRMLSQLLNQPEAQDLVRRMGGTNGPNGR